MFKNYLIVAVRNLLRYRLFSAINIFGLSVGMACCILILLYVQDELSYDRFNEKAHRIYRITFDHQSSGHHFARIPSAWAPVLVNNFPEIISAVRFSRNSQSIQFQDRHFREDRFFSVDGSVFDIFTFPLIKGDPETALREPNSIVLTEEMAQKYFGATEPLGKILTVRDENRKLGYRVTGISKKTPRNSHLRYDFLASFENPDDLSRNWKGVHFYTYLLLEDGVSPVDVEKRINAYIEERWPLWQLGLNLQPLTDIHLYSRLEREIESNGDIRYVYIFSLIALFTVLVSCINFMNLTTARASNRIREIGIRKVAGADRLQLIRQFLGESVLLSFVAVFLATGLVELSLPAFNSFMSREFSFSTGNQWWLIQVLVSFGVCVGLLAGGYPALFLSRFQPVDILRGSMPVGTTKTLYRKILVVVQFAISTLVITGTLACYHQLKYLENKNLGLNQEQIIDIPLSSKSSRSKYESMKSELLQNPDVLLVSASLESPSDRLLDTGSVHVEGMSDAMGFRMSALPVDHDFIEMFDIRLIAGRNFSEEYTTDVASAFILNEAAVKTIGWQSPEEAIGKQFRWHNLNGVIIGVTRDFHFSSLHYEIEPLVLLLNADWLLHMLVKVHPERVHSALAFLEDTWHERFPDHLFEYVFLDDLFEKLYSAEEKLSRFLTMFSILTVLIASLGLFGLAGLMAAQRTKEIGIRKALGASVTHVVLLLSKEFAKLITVAAVIACPVAYYCIDKWLQSFAYRANIGLGIFMLAGVSALTIALLAVGYQVIKSATANAVDALRYE